MTQKTLSITLTARDTVDRLTPQSPVAFAAVADTSFAAAAAVTVDTTHRFQTVEGFGGAITESTAVTLQKMPEAARREILRAYFDPAVGHGYNLCRVHMNSCDFSTGNYSCSEVAEDFELKHFQINRDRKALLPLIKDAFAVAGAPFKLFLSPWSPPAWMKTTGEMNHGGKLRPDCRDAWATHYCRFIEEYGKEGVPFWGLTVQNEPAAKQRWDSCLYTAEEERDFVRDHLGPALHRDGFGHLKLMIWDHNRDYMFERAQPVFDDPAAAKYVWGTAFHWYVGDHFDNVQAVHDAWPDKQLLFSEGCQECWGGDLTPWFNAWQVGERYGRSVIQDLNHWTVGWVDWNLVLDEVGGPNHVGNYCSAPILADTKTGKVHYQSSYWYLGHFSRFIQAGARRVTGVSTRDELETTAFLNPDGTVAVVIMNRTENSIRFDLKYNGLTAPVRIPARAIQTLTFAA